MRALSILVVSIGFSWSLHAQESADSSGMAVQKVLEGILTSANSFFGLNGSIEDDLQTEVEDASARLGSGSAMTTAFRLYPFLNYGQIGLDPNQNFLLTRGPMMDFSQTHTLLPNYRVIARYDSVEGYVFEDRFGGREGSLKSLTVVTKTDYLRSSFGDQSRNLFSRSVAAELSRSEEKRSGAVRIFTTSVTTNETFRKIFGGDQVAVDATGNINLSVSGQSEKTSSQNLITGKQSDFTPKFEQKQQFNLRGTIGEKVEILFDQDSEREFDFENNVKVTYTGYDDEVLQKLEAGNIDLSLPATEFVTAGSQNKGLFGVKSILRFGNLNMTTIASLQRGEKTKLSYKSGSGQLTAVSRASYDYAKNQFFFLSNSYLTNYEQYFGDRSHTFNPDQQIIELRIYRGSEANRTTPGAVLGIARTSPTDPAPVNSYFIEMKRNEEYTYDDRLGVIYLRSALSISDNLAIYYQTQDGTVVGDILHAGTENDKVQLQLIRRANPSPTDTTWNLEMKNIYVLAAAGQLSEEDVKTIKIRFDDQSSSVKNKPTSIPDKNGQTRTIMEIVHLDERGPSSTGADDIVDQNFIDASRGLLVFPRLRPFDPPANSLGAGFGEEVYPTDTTYRFPSFYDGDRLGPTENRNRGRSQFVIEFQTASRSTSINLGINVLEGSEEIKLDGRPLERNVGYTIDYFSGALEILDPGFVLSADATLEVSYEQAQLFQIDKKSIFGARAEYNLSQHGFGQNSFIGTTALFQSQSTINKRVQVGEEPFRNFVWDVNTNVDLEAKALTKAANWIPMVSATQLSRINFRAEYARLVPTPNTSNGLMRNDENGVAYLDDFEGVKRTFPLGAIRKTWSLASTPSGRDSTRRGHLIWYQIQTKRQNISPIAQSSDNISALGVAFQPDKTAPLQSWNGIMRAFSAQAENEIATSQFMEIWIRNEKNHAAKLHINIGLISEDQNSDGRLNSEVKSAFTPGISEKEDIGLDELTDEQEDSVLTANGIPPNTSTLSLDQEIVLRNLSARYPWGLINFARSGPSEDPFGDKWESSHANISTGSQGAVQDALRANDISNLKPNGTQGSRDDGDRRGDTEDLNINGVLDETNSYLTYSLSIDTLSLDTSLIIGRGRDGWKLYRIPLGQADGSVGAPSLTNIRAARVWVEPETGNTDVISFEFTEFQFINAEWTRPIDLFAGGVILPTGMPPPPKEELEKIVEISAVNTEENDFYNRPKDVRKEKIETTSGRGIQEVREQSLALILNELPAGATAIITKSLQQPLDVRNYSRLRMFVHGDTTPASSIILPGSADASDSPLRFFFRFGADINNYFEIEQPLYRNWTEERNNIDLDLSDLSRKKFSTVEPDALQRKVFHDPETGKTIRIKGNPSLSNLRNLFMGVINNDPSQEYSGQIWADEMRVSGAQDKPGDAAKASLFLNMSDLLNLNGLIQYRSAEFRTVEQRFDANGGNTTNLGINGSLSLHKFYLERYGVALPLVFNYSQSITDPKYVPGNDLLVRDARTQNNDNLSQLSDSLAIIVDSLQALRSTGGSLFDVQRLMLDSGHVDTLRAFAATFDDRIRTVTTSRGFTLNFSKQKRAENFWLTRYTLDNLTSSLSYALQESRNPQQVINRVTTWTTAATYQIGFERKSFKPFTWMPLQSVPVIGNLFSSFAKSDFNYGVLTRANTDFSLTKTETDLVERDALGNPVKRVIQPTLTAQRGYGWELSPLQALTSSINVRFQSDLRGLSASQIAKGVAKGLNPLDGFNDFTYAPAIDTIRIDSTTQRLILNRDFGAANTFSLTYRPETFSFLTHSLTYNANHNLNRQRPSQSVFNKGSQLSRRVQIDATYSLRNMIGLVGQGGRQESTGGKSRRDRFKSLNPSHGGTETKKDTATAGESKFRFVTRKIGGVFEKALNTVNDLRFTINFDDNITMNGLPQNPDAAFSWFGYSTTDSRSFLGHVFSFDLDTVNQIGRDSIESSRGLFAYSARKTINYGFTYGFNFNFFTVDLRYDVSETRSLQTNRETRSETRSVLFPWLKSLPVPLFYDITVRANNIGRWPLFNLMAGITRSMNLSVTYNSKQSINRSQFNEGFYRGIDSTLVPIIRQKDRSFQADNLSLQRTFPQVGYDIQWKGGVSQTITFTNTSQKTVSLSSTQNTQSINILTNINYTKRGGFRIPIWFLKKKQINNEIRFAATAALTRRKSFSKNQSGGVTLAKQKIDDATTWSVEPRFDYSFTNRLTGGLFMKYEYNKSLQSGKITRLLAGLNVNISIGS